MVINIGRRKPRFHQGRIPTAVLYSCITLSTQYSVLSISCSLPTFWSVVVSEAGSCIIVGGPVISAEKEAALPRASLSSSASSLRVCCFNCLINRVNFSTFSALRPNFYAANVEKHKTPCPWKGHTPCGVSSTPPTASPGTMTYNTTAIGSPFHGTSIRWLG